MKDKIVTGIAGGEYGIRGFLDAYDPKTGKRLWRFWTVPGSGEKGNDSWTGDSWKRGGAPTWVTGSYDASTNLVYWGAGNPSPDWNGDVRKGDNLYSSSVVAVDADTGKLKWHFQFTPHDLHDWDATQVPVLVDAVFRGRQRKLMAGPIAMRSFTYSIARQASSCRANPLSNRPGRRDWMTREGRSAARTPPRAPKGRWSTLAYKEALTGTRPPTAR